MSGLSSLAFQPRFPAWLSSLAFQPARSRQVVSSCFPASWRVAVGGTPCPVRWLPGAGRWPGPPGFFFLRVMACRRRRRAPLRGMAARCRTVTCVLSLALRLLQRAFRSFVRGVPQGVGPGRVLDRFSAKNKGFSFPYRPLPGRVRRRVRPLVGGVLFPLILIRDIWRGVRYSVLRAKC